MEGRLSGVIEVRKGVGVEDDVPEIGHHHRGDPLLVLGDCAQDEEAAVVGRELLVARQAAPDDVVRGVAQHQAWVEVVVQDHRAEVVLCHRGHPGDKVLVFRLARLVWGALGVGGVASDEGGEDDVAGEWDAMQWITRIRGL